MIEEVDQFADYAADPIVLHGDPLLQFNRWISVDHLLPGPDETVDVWLVNPDGIGSRIPDATAHNDRWLMGMAWVQHVPKGSVVSHWMRIGSPVLGELQLEELMRMADQMGNPHGAKIERNAEMVLLYRAGMKKAEIARKFAVTSKVVDELIAKDNARREFEKNNRSSDYTLSTPIEFIEMPTLMRHCLMNIGAKTLGDVSKFSDAQLLNIPNLGKTSLKKIKVLIAAARARSGDE